MSDLGDAEFASAELDRLLYESRKILKSLRAARTSPESGDIEGVAEAADGMVRVVAKNGRLRSVELNPRALRIPSAELADHIVTAVNGALDDLAARMPTAGAEPKIDPEVLAEQVREIQDQGMRQMSLMLQGIRDAVAQAQRGPE